MMVTQKALPGRLDLTSRVLDRFHFLGDSFLVRGRLRKEEKAGPIMFDKAP